MAGSSSTGGVYRALFEQYGTRVFSLMAADGRGRAFCADPASAFQAFAAYDPTANDGGKQYRFLGWLCRHYIDSHAGTGGRQGIPFEDLYKIRDDLRFFQTEKKRYPDAPFEKDIFRLNPQSLSELVKSRSSAHAKSGEDLRREIRAEIHQETDFLYTGPEGQILVPKTERAACFWGQGTRWCTAATSSDNAFDEYNEDGPLVIYIPDPSQGGDWWGTASKFQGHCTQGLSTSFDPSDYRDLHGLPWNLRQLVTAAITHNPDLSLFLWQQGGIDPRHIRPHLHTIESWREQLRDALAEDDESDNSSESIFSRHAKVCALAPDEVWEDEDFCVEQVGVDSDILFDIPPRLRSKAVYLAALEVVDDAGEQRLQSIVDHIPAVMWEDEGFRAAAVAHQPVLLTCFDRKTITADICLSAFRAAAANLDEISLQLGEAHGKDAKALRQQRDQYVQGTLRDIFNAIPDTLRQDSAFTASLCKTCPDVSPLLPQTRGNRLINSLRRWSPFG